MEIVQQLIVLRYSCQFEGCEMLFDALKLKHHLFDTLAIKDGMSFFLYSPFELLLLISYSKIFYCLF